ncbi:MAG TPA: thioesterase family protein [Thermoanaerobaculia bacterium]|jgi:acyl-CoA thioester hydrolase|nr:thioesterase family protein [Thermoanaerobaculia bacterium]
MSEGATTGYPVRAEIPVRFRDIDGLGHVNNAVIVTYLEITRETYRRKLGESTDISEFAFLLARVECDFRKPIPYNTVVHARVGCSRIGTKSWELVYRLESPDGATLWAEALTVQVVVDFATGASKEIPAEIRAAMVALEQTSEV